MLSEDDMVRMKRPNLWKYHNEALKDPQYLVDGLMDCYREEQSFYQPFVPSKSAERLLSSQETSGPEWTKRQWGEVQQLKAQVLFLSNKINEMRANASKGKTNRYNKYSNE